MKSLSMFATVGGLLWIVGCGASEARTEFGASNDGAADSGAGGEVLPPPPADIGSSDSGSPGIDAPTQGKCTATSTHTGTVCVHVDRGTTDAPALGTDEATTLNLDGDGVLLVALMPDPWTTTAKASALRTFPSASATPHFYVGSDLPKTADLDVPPGRYFAFAVFYDKPGFGSRDLAPGDWVPKMENSWLVPEIDIGAGEAKDETVHLYPVRGADLNVALGADAHPIGSGSGPLVASILGSGSVVGEGRLPCADLQTGAPTVRILTTAPPSTSYPLKVGVYDFATGPDDPSLDGVSTTTAPPGAIVNWSDGATPTLEIGKGWQSPTTNVVLDRVIPFTTTVPADPTPACTSYAAAPK